MAHTLPIRVATESDAPLLGQLLEASYSRLMRESYSREILAAALPLLTQPSPVLLSSGTYYLAEGTDRRPVGCGGWTLERPGTGEVVRGLAHIRHFATHPDCVGRGIGRAVFEKCESEARGAGANRFECYASLNAVGFYASLGFGRVRPVELAMGDGVRFPALLMRRSI